MSDELTRKLHATDDAMVWAIEWCKVAERLSDEGQPIIDEGWMVGWFANAIEVAKRIDRERHPERKPAQDIDYVLLPRDALFQFFGQHVLPRDDTDCAPVASMIVEWVEANDLGDLYRGVGALTDREPHE